MGKEAFKAKKGQAFLFDPDELVLITDKDHPLYDDRVHLPVSESMVKSMLHNGQGVLQPIVITKDGDRPVVVDGRQRTKAARAASDKIKDMGGNGLLVPCVYRRGNDSDLASIMISTNEIRTQDTPIQKGKKANTLINFGHSKKEVAEIFGCTVVTLESYLDLLSLDPETQKKVETGEIKKTAAVKVARQPRKERKKATMTARPRLRKRAEIEKALAEVGDSQRQIRRVLQWVLNETDSFWGV
jgi:ParB family chromosome partitioning protein